MIWRSCSHAWVCGLWWNHCTNIQNLKINIISKQKKKLETKIWSSLSLFHLQGPRSALLRSWPQTQTAFFVFFSVSVSWKSQTSWRGTLRYDKKDIDLKEHRKSHVSTKLSPSCSWLPSVQANWELATPKVQADSWTSGAVGSQASSTSVPVFSVWLSWADKKLCCFSADVRTRG